MPIYEYYSPDTHKIYSFFVRSLSDAGRTPKCPDGAEKRMEKRLSAFSITGVKKKGLDGGEEGDLDDPRMEAAMREMEREMAGLDENNPDPRAMSQLMRKMSEMTGEPLPPAMEEMLARMEKGEDPEKLEEEYGDVLDAEGGFGDEGGEGSVEGGGAGALLKKLRGRKGPAKRDPQLYELADYI